MTPHSLAPRQSNQLFQPPQSPALTNTSSNLSTANDYFSQRSRKRQRPGFSDWNSDIPNTPGAWRDEQENQRREALTPSWVQCPTPTDRMYDSAGQYNSELVNERYALRGGFDTPGLLASDVDDGFNRDADMDCRRRVRDSEYFDRGTARQAMISGPLARERNGVARMPSYSNGEQNQAGWASLAFSLVGSIFNFGSSVVKGFYAGGGKGYDLPQQGLSDSWTQMRSRDGQTPVPGSWRDDGDFMGDFEQDNPSSPSFPPARPPNKRRQTDRDAWVMVGTPDASELSPKRKSSSTSVPRSHLAMRPPASRAGSRRSLAPVSRRTTGYMGSPAVQHISPSIDPTDIRRASVASTRSPNINRPSSSHRASHSARPSLDGRPVSASGISPEAEKYIKRQARQEKLADKAIGNMDRQLKEMIAQAQQALGTKYEIDGGGGGDLDMDMDEGFVDEEW